MWAGGSWDFGHRLLVQAELAQLSTLSTNCLWVTYSHWTLGSLWFYFFLPYLVFWLFMFIHFAIGANTVQNCSMSAILRPFFVSNTIFIHFFFFISFESEHKIDTTSLYVNSLQRSLNSSYKVTSFITSWHFSAKVNWEQCVARQIFWGKDLINKQQAPCKNNRAHAAETK